MVRCYRRTARKCNAGAVWQTSQGYVEVEHYQGDLYVWRGEALGRIPCNRIGLVPIGDPVARIPWPEEARPGAAWERFLESPESVLAEGVL